MAGVEIGVLGPFELRVAGALVAVPAGERALLARLARSAGRAVSVERLVDDLWEGDLPADPRNALQLRVSKLRRVVGDALVRDGAGYRLDIDADAVDAARFRRLIAARRHDEALGLWRAGPLEEFADRAWARAEAAELTELRMAAREERMALRLERGEAAALVPDLVALVADDPLRERPRAQLMTALARAGRTADALAAYRDYRLLLRDELGLAPSESLRRLEEAIIRDDPSVVASPGGGPARPTLPAPLTRLIGREAELERVPRLLDDARLLTLVGPGGAGKTTVAVAAAAGLAGRHPDGAWFVPLGDLEDAGSLPAAVADAMGLADPDARSVEALVAAWLSPRRALLILDNCEHVIDECAQLVHDLLSAAPGLDVLATSREPLGIPGEVQLRLPPLDPEAAATLFAERARAARPDFDAGPAADDVAAIVERLDGMPLAIELAAARITTMTAAEIAAGLDDRFGLLTRGPRTAEARHRTLRAVVDWSHALIGPDERAILRRLAVFRGGWTVDAAAAVGGVDAPAALDAMSSLVDRSLVIAEAGRFGMLETIRAYAQGRLAEAGEEETTRRRHAAYHAALAEAAEPELRGADQARWLTRLRQEDANMRVALEWARDAGDGDLALRLAGALGWYWYVGRQSDGLAQIRATLDAVPVADPGARARALQALSLAVRPAGCIVHASDEGARAAAESLALLGDAEPGRAALSRLLVAVQGVAEEDPDDRLAQIGVARSVLRDHGDTWGVALADFVEMEIRLHHGAADAALEFGHRAADAFDALGDPWGRSAVRLHLGHGLRLAGRIAEAEDALGLAVEVSAATGLPNNLARSWIELGEAALHRGAPDDAEEALRRAEAIAGDVGSDTLRALALLGRGAVARYRADPGAARALYREALDISVAAAVPRSEARARAGLAAAALDRGEAGPDVTAELDRAMAVMRRIGDLALVAGALEQAARAAAAGGDAGARERLVGEADRLRAERGRPRGALEERDRAR